MNVEAAQLEKSKALELGQPLQAVVGADRMPLGPIPTKPPLHAMRESLAAFLGQLVWATEPGKDDQGDPVESVRFRLNEVTTKWPNPKKVLNYPAASIVNAVEPFEDHSLTPTMLEETFGLFCQDMVLWKTSEMVVDFQVDFWTTSDGQRQAIEAGLPRAFNPTESRAGVLLRGHEDYFFRPVRCSLMDHAEKDVSAAIFERERRLLASVHAEMDVVHLREAVGLRIVPLPIGDLE